MEIRKKKQLNQGVGKYKLLSTNAGVGSILPTKWGGLVMPQSTTEWGCVDIMNAALRNSNGQTIDKIAEDNGVELIEDKRFMYFLKDTEDLVALRCLVAIPHVTLDKYNQCNIEEHPINKQYKRLHPNSQGFAESNFTIPAIIFPRWFYSPTKKELRPLEEWEQIWKQNGCNHRKRRGDGNPDFFAPPRDPYAKTNRKQSDNNLGDDAVYKLLEQMSMVLICPNGHISDIPWDKYFSAKVDGKDLREEGFDLFNYKGQPCSGNDNRSHELLYMESKNNPESLGLLKCKCCGAVVSLEGIMSLKPKCHGDKPWENIRAYDHTCKDDATGKASTMRYAMATSNSVYYADCLSSLLIPCCYFGENLSADQQKVLDLLKSRWFNKYKENNPNATPDDYVKNIGIPKLQEKADDSGYTITQKEMKQIVAEFCGNGGGQPVGDVRENYRFEEYSVFMGNNQSKVNSERLRFTDIDLPDSLKPYFTKIQQVDALAISSTQIGFSRVSAPTPDFNDNGAIEYPHLRNIFSEKPEEVKVLPANQKFGEGLFFSLNEDALRKWEAEHSEELDRHYATVKNHDEMYENTYQKMKRGGISRFFLLHTLSHVIMKELEFSCGYPSASLQERLYFSERMCGVLIYTADGSEGSMGGLVWQGQPNLIEGTIRKAMQRALDCASDPICWENDDQMNYAACFSCAMVSETSCEERNVGLDRRALVDDNYGFFKNLI